MATRLFQLLLHREWLTEKLIQHGKCYPPLILQRARVYEALQYPDLAAFDAYTVYTLCQKELSDEFVTDLIAHDLDGRPWLKDISDRRGDERRMHEARCEKVRALAILVRCLTDLGATVDAARLREELEEDVVLSKLSDTDVWVEQKVAFWTELLRPPRNVDGATENLDIAILSQFGHSRREIYPWSDYEPSRNTPESVNELNSYLSGISSHLEAKVTALPAFDDSGNATGDKSYQLGLFAKSNLPPGQQVLNEKSLLTAIRPLEDAICDACGQELEEIPFEDVRQCDGDDCDITFCSQECKDRAEKEYHRPRLDDYGDEEDENDEDENDEDAEDTEDNVGKIPADEADESENATVEREETQRSGTTPPAPFCSNTDLSLIGRPTNTITPEWDLYFLLLTRTIAMSLTQTTHPLSLPETKYLWGDFNPTPFAPNTPLDPNHNYQRTLPFSFVHNLQYTLDYFSTLSLSEPRATPYSPHWLRNFDFWILQTLTAKFRGVANATQSTFDGKPEIASVHPGWCLANHSCDPNVTWTPKGTRKFFVRTQQERADCKREGGGGSRKPEWTGIEAGEEVFSHYTDIRLPVQERRERLREVLGGNCRCERCVNESQETE